jgi:hypothetical protein
LIKKKKKCCDFDRTDNFANQTMVGSILLTKTDMGEKTQTSIFSLASESSFFQCVAA